MSLQKNIGKNTIGDNNNFVNSTEYTKFIAPNKIILLLTILILISHDENDNI